MVAYTDIGTITEVNLGTGQNGNTINIGVARPGVSTSGNMMFAQLILAHDTSSGTGPPDWTLPSGWTQLTQAYANTAGYWYIICYKVDSGSEPATFTWSYTADTRYVYCNGVISEYTATNGTIDAFGMGTESTGTDKVAPSLTSNYTNSLMIVLAYEDNYSNSTCSGFTERYDNASFAPKIYDKAITTTGSTGTATVVSSAGNGYAVSILLLDTTPTGGSSGQPAMARHKGVPGLTARPAFGRGW